MNKNLFSSGLMTFSIVSLVGCGGEVIKSDTPSSVTDVDVPPVVTEFLPETDEVTETVVESVTDVVTPEAIVPGVKTDTPSPFSDKSPEAVELSPDEKKEAEQRAISAKDCTDGGGLFNTEMGKCFKDAAEESKEMAKDGSAGKLEILESDDAETVKRKECINNGGAYNTQQQECFEGLQ